VADRKHWEPDEIAHLINAMNPNQMELWLASQGPGAPKTMEDAVARVNRGEPVMQPPGGQE
jgi:hypothetical protein